MRDEGGRLSFTLSRVHAKRGDLKAFVLFIGVLATICPAQGQTRQSNFQLCFPLNTWSGSPAPTIDGQIGGDPGWDSAFQYVFGNGGSTPDAIVRGIRDDSNLYIAIQSYNLDTTLTASPVDYYQTTLVVLGFDPGNGTDSQTGDPAHMQRIHVSPIVANAASGYRGPIFGTHYWSGGVSTWTSPGSTNTSWLGSANIRVGYDKDSVTGKFIWSLEMKLPISGNLTTGNPLNGIILPDSGFFGFYLDIFPVVKVGAAETFVPEYWPSVAPEPGCTVGTCTPDGQTPAASLWGNATRDSDCGGVSVTLGSAAQNVFTSNAPPSKIALNAPNTFGAYVQNTSVDASSGTAVPTSAQVSATFRIANWGLPPLYQPWGLVPTPTTAAHPNPTPIKTIPATSCTATDNNNNASCIVNTGAWDLTGTAAANNYNTPTTTHQCIRVELAPAPGTNTVVLNPSVQRNMDFGNASQYERIAEISAKGYPPRPDNPDGTKNDDQVFDLHITTREEVIDSGQVQSGYRSAADSTQGKGSRSRVISQLTWIANGCRHTGRYMTILEQRLEICEPIGAFGYVIRHEGNAVVKNWQVRLVGDHLVKADDNVYQIRVPLDGVATVTTSAEPQDTHSSGSKRIAAFLDAGVAIPHGAFGSALNTGFSLNAGLEYLATNRFSAEGIFGYHRFPSMLGTSLGLYQFSANGKIYVSTSGSLRPFINAGLGGYKFRPGSTYFGGNFGGGVLKELTSQWGLQGSYNFHVVNTSGSATTFSAIEGGVRFVF